VEWERVAAKQKQGHVVGTMVVRGVGGCYVGGVKSWEGRGGLLTGGGGPPPGKGLRSRDKRKRGTQKGKGTLRKKKGTGSGAL